MSSIRSLLYRIHIILANTQLRTGYGLPNTQAAHIPFLFTRDAEIHLYEEPTGFGQDVSLFHLFEQLQNVVDIFLWSLLIRAHVFGAGDYP